MRGRPRFQATARPWQRSRCLHPAGGRRHPGVEVHLVEEGGVRLHALLDRGDVHLATMLLGGSHFQSRLLYPTQILAALAPTHRLTRRATLEIADLRDEPLLMLHRDFGSRDWFDAACSVAHIRPRVLLESAAPHTLVALAATDYGIAILTARSELRASRATRYQPTSTIAAASRSRTQLISTGCGTSAGCGTEGRAPAPPR
jgi:LysR substrate binding domain-containing protein